MAKQKVIKGDLVLEADFRHDCDLKVEGNIICKGGYWDIDCRNINAWDIKAGNIICENIDCRDINCWNIDCWNVDCGDINCENIDCVDINCRNIDCWDIICEKRIKKSGNAKTFARIFITDRSKLKKKEW